eukprot:CAMPEP_0202979114 /NCGR_PEP_ID=MMETSP1396-20130829/85355_1 /ASSEMBLY_ACC=CAM_ASM_000872 /TAXON_ID= /ORGANISM="Pseudokeronopsis sp., Strain Brazil" /LENGTH=74 /DNA_ID=CAMNT_0049718393 /DNA_START=447 /DNA_END=671 /DNA_ORIENTATION=-
MSEEEYSKSRAAAEESLKKENSSADLLGIESKGEKSEGEYLREENIFLKQLLNEFLEKTYQFKSSSFEDMRIRE